MTTNKEIREKIKELVNWHTRLILIAEGDLVYGKEMDEELKDIEKADKKIVDQILQIVVEEKKEVLEIILDDLPRYSKAVIRNKIHDELSSLKKV